MNSTAITFILYLIVLLIIGWAAFKSTKTFGDYVLGGRGLNVWVTSISAQASDMSAWLLMGLPGLAYASGVSALWTAIGISVGTLFNWKYIAKKLRIITELTNSLTISDYFENRFEDSSKLLRLLSAVIIVVFFVINISAELVASGKLMNASFGFSYDMGILVGMGIIILYTFFGGFFAVSWTDLFQGLLMVTGLVVLPLTILSKLGGFSGVINSMGKTDPNLLLVLNGETGILAFSGIVIGALAMGLGYPGQPHILVRFMAIKHSNQIRRAMLIAMIWVLISLYGAILVGFIGHGAFASLDDPEQVLILLAEEFLNPWLAGVFIAVIMAAIMSSVDSYLLVSSASIAEDFIAPFANKKLEDRTLKVISQIAVIVISILAYLLAKPGGVVFTLALYAWGGLASSIGTVIILSLFWKRTTKWGAVAGMIVGMVTTIVWYNSGLSSYIYELVPAFFLSLLTIIIVSLFTSPPSKNILEKLDQANKPLSSEYDVLRDQIDR